MGCLEIIREAYLKVPDDISIIAFDDVGPLHLFGPPLTAIRRPVEHLGRRGVERVVSLVKGRALDAAIERLPIELVVRSSVGLPAKQARMRGRTRRTAHVHEAH